MCPLNKCATAARNVVGERSLALKFSRTHCRVGVEPSPGWNPAALPTPGRSTNARRPALTTRPDPPACQSLAIFAISFLAKPLFHALYRMIYEKSSLSQISSYAHIKYGFQEKAINSNRRHCRGNFRSNFLRERSMRSRRGAQQQDWLTDRREQAIVPREIPTCMTCNRAT